MRRCRRGRLSLGRQLPVTPIQCSDLGAQIVAVAAVVDAIVRALYPGRIIELLRQHLAGQLAADAIAFDQPVDLLLGGAIDRKYAVDQRLEVGFEQQRYHDQPEAKRKELLGRRGIEETVVERGWYRHLNIPEMFDVLTDGKIAKRIASLLGEHVMMWRSQCFEVAPGSKGTGLHQTADFGIAERSLVHRPQSLDDLGFTIGAEKVDLAVAFGGARTLDLGHLDRARGAAIE